MVRLSIEQYLYSNYIKYDKMLELTRECFSNSNAEVVNVFIDMNSIVKSLYRFTNLSIEDYSVVTSSIINLCAHIKNYYAATHHVKTNIYIVHSTNCSPSSKQFIVDYNKKYECTINANKKITDLINSNIDLLKILCPYLEDIFFIEDVFETSVVILDLILKNEANGNNYPNIVFSKDIFAYQLPAINNNTVLFRSCKRDGKDISWQVNNSNVIRKYIEDSRGKNIPNSINGGLLSAIMALTNVPNRSITSVYNISKAISLIELAISNKIITNGYNSDISHIVNFIDNSTGTLQNRFRAIDICFQHSMYINTPYCKNNTIGIKNLYDPETVKALNNQYFRSNPLDLNRL